MFIREVTDKNTWEQFFIQQKDKTFLQSWAWGELQQILGNKVWHLGVYDEAKLITAALLVKVVAKRGTFLMVQHNVASDTEVLQFLVREIKRIGKTENAHFIRTAPLWERNQENQKFVSELGLREAPMHVSAYESSWKLDITPTEENLLAAMRKTTRYVIRQTEKNKDIEVIKSISKKDVELFLELNKEVGIRQQFVPFSERYIKSEFDVFEKNGSVILIFGKYQGKIVAAALVVFWSNVAYYHQAASLGEYAKYSVPYLVQWEAIKEAKRRGCTLYDFWGYIDPKKYPRHPWAGPTLFKMGFGGQAFEYIKTQDYPLSWRYWPVAIFETFRAKRRRLS